MRSYKILGAAIMVMIVALVLLIPGCFGNNNVAGSNGTPTPTVVKPAPRVENVVATTSGTQSAYYVTLDIKVKNDGSEGTFLVKATVTQNVNSYSNEMPVFLKRGEEHELKLTFPLVWQGGDFTSDVKVVIP
jgi:hypothetical protein